MALVRYIDANPVSAGLAGSPQEYPFCSAFHYARRRGPRWLSRDWVEGEVKVLGALDEYDVSWYPHVFGAPTQGFSRLIERRLDAENSRAGDPLDHLLDATPERILRWMRAKTRVADGTSPGLPVADPETVVQVVRQEIGSAAGWYLRVGGRP